jgi:hypothetical protein
LSTFRSYYLGARRVTVCHEAAEKMRADPSDSLYRKRFQTTHKLLWSKATVVVRQESSFTRQLLMHKMCYATEKMGVGPPDSHYRM